MRAAYNRSVLRFPKGNPPQSVVGFASSHGQRKRLAFCVCSSRFGTHNGYPLCYETPRSSSLVREDKLLNYKKISACNLALQTLTFSEIRQLAFSRCVRYSAAPLGHRSRTDICAHSSRAPRTAGIRCPMNCRPRPPSSGRIDY